MVRDFLTYAKEQKFTNHRKDPNAMDLDRLDYVEKLTRDIENARAEYQEDRAGQNEYTEDAWVDHMATLNGELDKMINWVGKKGTRLSRKGNKGNTKGKGKGEQPRERNPVAAHVFFSGEKDIRVCRWCDKAGSVMKDCRAKAAGKPQHPKHIRKPMKSLEEEDEWEEQQCFEEVLKSLEECEEYGFIDVFDGQYGEDTREEWICDCCRNEFVEVGESNCEECKGVEMCPVNIDPRELAVVDDSEWDEWSEEDEPPIQRWRQPLTSPAETARSILRPMIFAMTPTESHASMGAIPTTVPIAASGSQDEPREKPRPAFPLTLISLKKRTIFDMEDIPNLCEQIENQNAGIRKDLSKIGVNRTRQEPAFKPPGLSSEEAIDNVVTAECVSGLVWISTADETAMGDEEIKQDIVDPQLCRNTVRQ